VKYLLDTNILVNHLRGKQPINISLLKKGVSISIISQAELLYGAYKSNKTQFNLRSIHNMLDDLNIKIINLNKNIISAYGKLKANLEQKGKKMDEFDLLIASTALSYNLKLATKNKKHFQRIPNLSFIKN